MQGGMRRTLGAAVLVTVVAVGGTALGGSAGAAGSAASATLLDPIGNVIGRAKLTPTADGKVMVTVRVQGLSAGFHGFHIHTVGDCSAADFTSAGGHFNPGATTHGSHAGDQPVLLVNDDGTGMGRFVTDRYEIADLLDADGSAFIVHAAADNYANIPVRYTALGVPGPDAATLATGDAGARQACGVIESAG